MLFFSLYVLRIGRDGKVCVFALCDFDELSSDQPKTKLDCKEHKLEKAKGNILQSYMFSIFAQVNITNPTS
jgi:hypothetical protein